MSLYYANVTVHVLAALLWLGGMFFLGLIGAPVLRTVEPASLRAELFRKLGERFRRVGWIAIGLLVATGVVNLHFRGVLTSGAWSDSAFWATRYGNALAWKLAAVLIMVGVSAVHDFVLGPAAGKLKPGTPAAVRMRTGALLARANALVGVVLVVAAVRLARGG